MQAEKKFSDKNTAAATPPRAAFHVWQSKLPHRLGISLDKVRARRKELLQEGVDWIQAGNRVLWTDAAVQRLQESLCVPSNGVAATEQSVQDGGVARCAEPAIEVSPAHVQLLDVLKQHAAQLPPVLEVVRTAPQIKNRRIVEVVREGEEEEPGNVRLLWVRDNKLFKVGHRIPPELYERNESAEGEQFTFTGRRPPR